MEENVQTQSQPQKNFIKQLFSFKGRAKRTEYWLLGICSGLLMLPVTVTDEADMSLGLALYALVMVIPLTWLSLAVVTRRFHDLGKSGWFTILTCIPVVNIIFGVYVAFFKGQQQDNEYGPNPY